MDVKKKQTNKQRKHDVFLLLWLSQRKTQIQQRQQDASDAGARR